MAYGSPEVRELLEEWSRRAKKLEDADWLIGKVEESRNPSAELDRQAMEEQKAVPSYVKAIADAHKAIAERVWRELAGQV